MEEPFCKFMLKLDHLQKLEAFASSEIQHMQIWYVCVRVYVCVFLPFYSKGFFRLQLCLGYTWVYGSTILCCEYCSRCFRQVPSSSFLQKVNKLERKRYDICLYEKMIYIDIEYKSDYAKPTYDEKI